MAIIASMAIKDMEKSERDLGPLPLRTQSRVAKGLRWLLELVLSAAFVAVIFWVQRLVRIFNFDRSWRDGIIPAYVVDYAPMVWLDKEEIYLPSDMLAQLENTHPHLNYTVIEEAPSPLTLENLDSLNQFGTAGGRNVFLTSDLDITASPDWLTGVAPDQSGKTNATSSAIIVNNKGGGIVDAFYMYFYAYNQGNTVFGQELGDHVGDWEHNMIRFSLGVPQEIWYSQHGNGQAFTYSCVEKVENIRPTTYSAKGSHANYGIEGIHEHSIPNVNLPWGFLQDHTSRGSLWDPILNAFWYTYNNMSETFLTASNMRNGSSPVAAMQYHGRWGDQEYPEDDPRQKKFFGFLKYVGGPTGPYNKQLNREKICADNGLSCIIRDKLGP